MALDNESLFEVLLTPLISSWSVFTSSNKCLLRRPFRIALRQCASLVVDFPGKNRFAPVGKVSSHGTGIERSGQSKPEVRRASTVGFVSQERDKIGHINSNGGWRGERG